LIDFAVSAVQEALLGHLKAGPEKGSPKRCKTSLRAKSLHSTRLEKQLFFKVFEVSSLAREPPEEPRRL
jgi:hypothetical protein